jgi:hypothetical protein
MLVRKKTFEEADHKAETEITKQEKDMGQRNWGFNTIKKNKIQTFRLGIKTQKKTAPRQRTNRSKQGNTK